MSSQSNCYHKLSLRNIDGKTYDFIFNDVDKCNTRFEDYCKSALKDVESGTSEIAFQDKSNLNVRLTFHLAKLDLYWTVQVHHNIGFDQ